MHVVVLNGPNLDRLGKRQPEIYGADTLADVEASVRAKAAELGVEVSFLQSNYEGQLIEWVHDAADHGRPVIINPGGWTHTSVALRDALVELDLVIEVHISNVHAREPFRQHSYISPIARGVIAGLGVRGYLLALEYVCGEKPVQ
ncbi:type II 3-dehydroquinate dehydratase [Corynebacterium sp.]|uniref:type II 3-dehydroquinate dehydratase n=1 Tax=Corynebacterium sp. TaxID=1720 RepID=UPI0026DA869F|nr:type II 3-dehydroquinate dehydratase [Corynebacterium sp.]MDO5077530.1 type II 3-dehydroquinate dehydratase [Corynebacterium sp.]